MCVKRHGTVAGRAITVVDTPGWWADHTLGQSDKLTKHQILLSVSLCPPEPHAVLLAIRLTTAFTEVHRRAVEQHLEQIDALLWDKTIVLFTYGDYLGGATIEQYIESEGEALQWLVEKCGNRYHVLNNDKRGAQPIELLNKVEETSAGHSSCHYKIEKNRIHDEKDKHRIHDEEERKREEERNFSWIQKQIDAIEAPTEMAEISQENVRENKGFWVNMKKVRGVKRMRELILMNRHKKTKTRRSVTEKKYSQSQEPIMEEGDETGRMQLLKGEMEDADSAESEYSYGNHSNQS